MGPKGSFAALGLDDRCADEAVIAQNQMEGNRGKHTRSSTDGAQGLVDSYVVKFKTVRKMSI